MEGSLVRDVIQCLVIFASPAVFLKLSAQNKFGGFFSPIVLCFGLGILLRNLNILEVNEALSNIIRDGTIACALPLLLFSSDVRRWFTQSISLLKGFLIAVSSGILATFIASMIFSERLSDVPIAGGMMVGIHTGGTPNLFAVGIAVGAPDELFTLVNSAQILGGAIYLLLLLSVGKTFFGFFLKRFEKDNLEVDSYVQYSKIVFKDVVRALAVVALILAVSISLSLVFYKSLHPTFIIVSVTTLGIIASSNDRINHLQGPFEIGDYLLLMFGIAVGLVSDFAFLIQEGGMMVLFVMSIFILSIVFLIIIAYLFNLDVDTTIVASAAAIFGPVFIPQVTRVLDNKSLLLGGITISLIGLAIGNYLGLMMYYLLIYLL